MALVQFEPPTQGTLKFTFNDIWTPEGLLKIIMWRDIDADNDTHFIGGQQFKTDNVVVQGTATERVRGNITVDVSPRVILRKPRHKKRIEKFFKDQVIDGFDLDFYDTCVPADILSVTSTYLTPITFKLEETPYKRLFTKYIKPDGDTEVYCAFYFKEDGTDEYVFVTGGQMQNAIRGVDHLWTHANTANPYWTFNSNKPLDRETIWSLKFSHVAMMGFGKVPPRPTQNTAETGTYYMPFFNDAKVTAHSADTSELPFAPFPITSNAKVCQGVWDVTYSSLLSADRVALWRRHIPAHYWIKLMADFAFGEDQYSYTCEASPFTFVPAKLGTEDATLGLYDLFDNSSRISITATERNVSLASDATPEKWFLLPQTLWGLYDQIDQTAFTAGNTNTIRTPVPQKHWANSYESGMEQLIELLMSLGYVLIFTGANSWAIYKRGSVKNNKFSFIIPSSASPELFPDFESGIKVTRRETFQNADPKAGEYDDWFAYIRSTGVQPNDWKFSKNHVANPLTFPIQAQKPAEFEMSLVFGDMSAQYDQGANNNAGERISWYSLGTPSHYQQGALVSIPSERFPNFTPLVMAFDGVYTDTNVIETSSATGYKFAPVMFGVWNGGQWENISQTKSWSGLAGATETFTTDGYIAECYRELVAQFYYANFVRSDEKYTITVPTITQFTDQTSGAATIGKKSWRYIDLLNQTELFGYNRYVYAIDRDWETMQTTLELYRTTPVLPQINVDDIFPIGNARYLGTTATINGVFGLTGGGTMKGTVYIEPVIPESSPVYRVTAKVMPAGTEYDFGKVDGKFLLAFDTTTSANGTYDVRVRAYSTDGTTADITQNVTIAN